MLRISDTGFIRAIRVVFSGHRAEDFREYHMFTDESFMPDPYLFWRIKPGTLIKPVGFMGKESVRVRAKDVFRVFCLGDSFTMGTSNFSYPQDFAELLNDNPITNKKFEVVNAGLSGYTSLQGYRLFTEIISCEPCLVITCFGWNDGCFTKRGADKEFRPANNFILQLERFCYKFRIYHLLKLTYYKLKYMGQNKENNYCLSRRVSLEDYRKNLISMAGLAKENGVGLVFATRPCVLEKEPWMESFIEDTKTYNEITRDISTAYGVYLFDAEKIFREHPEYFVDACHMNHEGCKMFAKRLYESLKADIF